MKSFCVLCVLSLPGCVGQTSGERIGAYGNPLRCSPDSIQDTSTGLQRCLLESYRPCEVYQTSEEPFEVSLGYHGKRLVAEERRMSKPADVEYVYRTLRNGPFRGDSKIVARIQTLSDPRWSEFGYSGGMLERREDSASAPGETTYVHDGRGRVVREVRIGTAPYELTRAYDRRNRLTKMVRVGQDPSETTYEYDGNGRLIRTKTVGLEHTKTTDYEYNSRGRLIRESGRGPGEEEVRYDYDFRGRLTQIERRGSTPSTTELRYVCH